MPSLIFKLAGLTVFILICRLFVTADVDMVLLPPASAAYHDTSYNDYSGSLTSAAVSRRYIQRGDWEAPDILLIAEDPYWKDSVKIIAAAAHRDGIPVYIMSDRDYIGKEDYLSPLLERDEVRILRVSYDSPWIRDYGPVQLKMSGEKIQWLDFNYTEDRPLDDIIPQKLAEYMNMPLKEGEYYLEGGAVISNGRGLCAVTETSLEEASVDKNSAEELEAFKDMLGCSALAILPALDGEITGHADIIAQFLAPDIAAVAIADTDQSSEIAFELDQAVRSLTAAAHSLGQRLRIVRLPIYVEGENFYSYVNGTRLGRSFLMPSFKKVPQIKEFMAMQAIRSVIPDVRLVPVPADDMAERGGAIHCITLGLNIPQLYDIEKFFVQSGTARNKRFISF